MTGFWFAFCLTLFAGLSTGIGALIVFVAHKGNMRFLSLSLGFSAGVMIYVSFMALLPQSVELLASTYPAYFAERISLAAFFGGVCLTACIDFVIPNLENPHELHHSEKDLQSLRAERKQPGKLLRIGLFTAFALTLHNFPEGLATFMSALSAPSIAYFVAFAVALHNIPEGIVVSVPIFYATGSRRKAFLYSFLSGLAEPVGAVIGYLILRPFIGASLLGLIFAIVAGIMVYISFDELLPAAEEYKEHHLFVFGLFLGMFLMALSLILL